MHSSGREPLSCYFWLSRWNELSTLVRHLPRARAKTYSELSRRILVMSVLITSDIFSSQGSGMWCMVCHEPYNFLASMQNNDISYTVAMDHILMHPYLCTVSFLIATASQCRPIFCATASQCRSIVCATAPQYRPIVCATVSQCRPIVCATASQCRPIVCATASQCRPIVCATAVSQCSFRFFCPNVLYKDTFMKQTL